MLRNRRRRVVAERVFDVSLRIDQLDSIPVTKTSMFVRWDVACDKLADPATGRTAAKPVEQGNVVRWSEAFDFKARIPCHPQDASILVPFVVRLYLRAERRKKSGFDEQGVVEIDLSEVAGLGPISKACLVHKSLLNSLLKINVKVQLNQGDIHFRRPSRKFEHTTIPPAIPQQLQSPPLPPPAATSPSTATTSHIHNSLLPVINSPSDASSLSPPPPLSPPPQTITTTTQPPPPAILAADSPPFRGELDSTSSSPMKLADQTPTKPHHSLLVSSANTASSSGSNAGTPAAHAANNSTTAPHSISADTHSSMKQTALSHSPAVSPAAASAAATLDLRLPLESALRNHGWHWATASGFQWGPTTALQGSIRMHPTGDSRPQQDVGRALLGHHQPSELPISPSIHIPMSHRSAHFATSNARVLDYLTPNQVQDEVCERMRLLQIRDGVPSHIAASRRQVIDVIDCLLSTDSLLRRDSGKASLITSLPNGEGSKLDVEGLIETSRVGSLSNNIDLQRVAPEVLHVDGNSRS